MRLRHSRHYQNKIINEINVVPYVDISLVLLLIFMISAPLIQQGVDIDLPKAKAKKIESIEEEPMIISVNQKAELFFNYSDSPKKPIAPSLLLARVLALKKVSPSLPVLVRGDRSASYGNIVRVMALLQQSGVGKIGLMTENE
jgi:biopolymer transport protein TolR